MGSAPSGYQTPKTNWVAGDIPTAQDFNRIENNIRAIDEGSRTIEPTQVPSGNTGTLRQLLDWFANRVKAILGTTNWYDSPPTTLQAAKSHINAAAPHSGHETLAGAQAKADAALATAKRYTDQEVAKVVDDLASHKNDYAKFLADYEYQVPTIMGTQIQLKKQSNTNRLFFRLDEGLSGDAITISLDNGVTSKPLKDINGNEVTKLPKGFVEVVEEAENFIYAPKGGMGNIKSVQRGTSFFSSGQWTRTVSINPVDITKSVIIFTVAANALSAHQGFYRADFLDSTTIKFEGYLDVDATYDWQVIEFENIKSLQKGTATISTGTSIEVPIEPIDITRSILIFNHSGGTYEFETSGFVGGQIISSTKIRFRQGASNYGGKTINWWVIEF